MYDQREVSIMLLQPGNPCIPVGFTVGDGESWLALGNIREGLREGRVSDEVG